MTNQKSLDKFVVYYSWINSLGDKYNGTFILDTSNCKTLKNAYKEFEEYTQDMEVIKSKVVKL